MHPSVPSLLLLLAAASTAVASERPPAASADRDRYVFETEGLVRYAFPTHINDLVIDRAASGNSEVFVVVVEPGKAPPLHVHHDTEQVFYILEGRGTLSVGDPLRTMPVLPGQVVRIPAHAPHSIRCDGATDLRYLCVDCFTPARDPKAEPTWDDHVRTVCRERGWDFSAVKRVPSR
jgi:mannose-6-phosphate isomerase-like protein (cupin superfamily)